jgi:tetratricopeptide (TPR) repeat protein
MMQRIVVSVWCLALLACSTAPKKPAAVFTLRNAAEAQLELANREADRGSYAAALDLIAEARRLAINADDPPLRIRTTLALGNILFSLGRDDEADASFGQALAEAEAAADKELAALSRIYRARARLFTLIAVTGDSGTANGAASTEIGEIRSRVQAELALIKNDKMGAALGWTIIGLTEKELRRWAEAEAALKKALAIHEELTALEQIAYDWYLIASVRSVAGRFDEAVTALNEAIVFDRRAENSYGLGKDWLALGDVYRKAGRAAEADAAYVRAAEIFGALGFEEDQQIAEDRRGRN